MFSDYIKHSQSIYTLFSPQICLTFSNTLNHQISRKLLLASNPQISKIALDFPTHRARFSITAFLPTWSSNFPGNPIFLKLRRISTNSSPAQLLTRNPDTINSNRPDNCTNQTPREIKATARAPEKFSLPLPSTISTYTHTYT